MNSTTKIQLTDLNPHLICVLCGGYLIDATTIIECIHSFCRTCIIRYLESSKYCPICDVQVHKTKPLTNVRSDKTLQTLVYKLVPGLFKDEMRRRREFYAANQDREIGVTSHSVNTSELRGEIKEEDDVSTKSDDEKISLCLQHCVRLPPYKNDSLVAAPASEGTKERPERPSRVDRSDRRYLLCPAGVTIGHIKKLLRMKFDLPENFRLEVFYSDESLRDVYTLLDVAHIYAWRRVEPLKLYYIVYDETIEKLHLTPPSAKDMARFRSETPAEMRKRANRMRRVEAGKRKAHEISDSEPSDTEPKMEDRKDDSGVIVLSGVDSDVHIEAMETDETIEKAPSLHGDQEIVNKEKNTDSHTETSSSPTETVEVNVSDSQQDVVKIPDKNTIPKEVVDKAPEEPVVPTLAPPSPSPHGSPAPQIIVIVEESEKQSEKPTTSSRVENPVESDDTPPLLKACSKQLEVTNIPEPILSNGIHDVNSSPNEKTKSPKSKSINDVVSKIKAKTSQNDQVIVIDILPGGEHVVSNSELVPRSDCNENKQLTPVIENTIVHVETNSHSDNVEPSKPPSKVPAKQPAKPPVKSLAKTSVKPPAKLPVKPPAKTPAKDSKKTPETELMKTVKTVEKTLNKANSKHVLNNNHETIKVPCDSTTPKPKTKKTATTKTKTKAKSKKNSCLQDSLVVNAEIIVVPKPKKSRKTKCNSSANGPASKKCKVDTTVDLTTCDVLSPPRMDTDIEVMSFELTPDPTNDKVVVVS